MEKIEGKPSARILLVEDDITLASLYQMRMEAEGFEVKQCNNGEEALQVAREYHPNLVLLDIMMPRLDGFDVLDILHNTPGMKDMKIIILSALGQPSDQARAKELGADEYLVKSQVVIAEVMARIRFHLDLPPLPPAQ
jgi:DNA-binding response OmpR family regulator